MTPDDVRSFYRDRLGEVPASVDCALEVVPDAMLGYMAMRHAAERRVGGDGLPGRYASLVFGLLDVNDRNFDGALNHCRAALDQGLRWEELMHGMIQTWIVRGFSGAWGTIGWRVVDALQREGFGPPAPTQDT